jgi:uncharacterized membrane protein
MDDDARWKVIAVYALYVVALFSAGLSLIVGAILAYLFRGTQDPVSRSHYEHQIGLFWRTLLGNVVNAGVFGLGLLLTFTLLLAPIGIPLMIISGLAFVWLFVMTLTRSVRGLMRVERGEGYPVPAGWGL